MNRRNLLLTSLVTVPTLLLSSKSEASNNKINIETIKQRLEKYPSKDFTYYVFDNSRLLKNGKSWCFIQIRNKYTSDMYNGPKFIENLDISDCVQDVKASEIFKYLSEINSLIRKVTK